MNEAQESFSGLFCDEAPAFELPAAARLRMELSIDDVLLTGMLSDPNEIQFTQDNFIVNIKQQFIENKTRVVLDVKCLHAAQTPLLYQMTIKTAKFESVSTVVNREVVEFCTGYRPIEVDVTSPEVATIRFEFRTITQLVVSQSMDTSVLGIISLLMMQILNQISSVQSSKFIIWILFFSLIGCSSASQDQYLIKNKTECNSTQNMTSGWASFSAVWVSLPVTGTVIFSFCNTNANGNSWKHAAFHTNSHYTIAALLALLNVGHQYFYDSSWSICYVVALNVALLNGASFEPTLKAASSKSSETRIFSLQAFVLPILFALGKSLTASYTPSLSIDELILPTGLALSGWICFAININAVSTKLYKESPTLEETRQSCLERLIMTTNITREFNLLKKEFVTIRKEYDMLYNRYSQMESSRPGTSKCYVQSNRYVTMSSLTIVCPNARRCVIKVTPGTPLRQAVEEACLKQGYEANNVEARNAGQLLDLSLPFRLSGLPNNATIELTCLTPAVSISANIALQLPDCTRNRLTFCTKSSPLRLSGLSNNATIRFTPLTAAVSISADIALQLPDGTRNQLTFCTESSLEHVVSEFAKQSGQALLSTDDGIPSIMYMNRQYTGDELKQTTLFNIGAASGTHLLRFSKCQLTEEQKAAIDARVAETKKKFALVGTFV